MNRLSMLVVASLALSACGFSSGLPGGTRFKDLTPAQNKEFCEAEAKYMDSALSEDDARKLGCLMEGFLAGVFSEDKKAACKSAFDGCVEKKPEAPEKRTCSEGSRPECTATVAEVEACVEDMAKALSDFVKKTPCEDIDKESAEDEQSAACKVISDKGCN